MTDLPELRDWKTLVENHLNKSGYTEGEILKLTYMCQDFLAEIQPIGQWVGQQQAFVTQMHQIFHQMYLARFGKPLPPRPTERPVAEVLLDTPERRKQIIREVALSISKPGDEISDEAVLQELTRRGMKIEASNSTAAISTILNGFKPQFEKIQGKRGIFRRQQ